MTKQEFEEAYDAIQAAIEALPANSVPTTQEEFFEALVAGPTASDQEAKRLRSLQRELKAQRARSLAAEIGLKDFEY